MTPPRRAAGAASAALLLVGIISWRSAQAWTSRGSGAGAAGVGTLPAAPAPTPSPTAGGANVRWPTPSATLDGVQVRRYDVSGSPAAAAGACAMLVVGTSCLDSPAPTGTYSYGLRAVRSAWTASDGPRGPTVVVAPSDTTPPTVAAVAIAIDGGTVSGYLRAGASYRVYARATDDSSAVAAVTTDVSSLTAGTTSAPLSSAGGPWTIDGATFGWRSSVLVSSPSLQHGATPAFEVAATDGAGNVGRRAATVTIDLIAPLASDWQTTNGGTLGRADAGDQVIFSFNEPLQPSSLVAGWGGSGSLSVVVRITDGGSGNDALTIWNASNSAQIALGGVSLERGDYVSATIAFGSTGTASTMSLAGGTVTVTLGTPGSQGAITGASGGWAIWTPSAAATDRAGNSCSTTARTEGGSRDREF